MEDQIMHTCSKCGCELPDEYVDKICEDCLAEDDYWDELEEDE